MSMLPVVKVASRGGARNQQADGTVSLASSPRLCYHTGDKIAQRSARGAEKGMDVITTRELKERLEALTGQEVLPGG